MDIFVTLLLKLIPLYVIIILGYIAGRFLKVDGKNISTMMFYMITPIIVFSTLLKTKIDSSVISLPFLIFSIGILLSLMALRIGKKIWNDSLPNVLALVAGTANSGFFGIPVALILFDEATVGIYITAMIGMTLFENSFGFYITAKGSMTARDAIRKVVRLPSLYAFMFGTILSVIGFQLPDFFESFSANMRGAYTVLGMMIIGFGLARVEKLIGVGALGHFRFMSMSFFIKFIIWPLAIFLILAIDGASFHFYREDVRHALTLISIMPVAANTVVIATLLDAHPDKVATTVFASTVFALFYVPLMVVLFLR